MSEINRLLNIIDSLADTSKVKVNDGFNLAINEQLVIEASVIGFAKDGIIIEADEKAIELLELNDAIIDESRGHKIVASKLKDIEARKKRDTDAAKRAEEERQANEKKKPVKEAEEMFNYDQWRNAKPEIKNDPISKLVRLGEPMVADWYDAGGYDSVRDGIIDMANDHGIRWDSAVIDAVMDEWGVRPNEEELEEATPRPTEEDEDMDFINKEIANLLRTRYNGKAWFNGGAYSYLIALNKPKQIYASDDSPIHVKSWAHGLRDYADSWAWKDLTDTYPDYWPNFFRPANKIRGQEDHELSVMRGDYGSDISEAKLYVQKPDGTRARVKSNKDFCIERVNPDKPDVFIIRHNCKNKEAANSVIWSCRLN